MSVAPTSPRVSVVIPTYKHASVIEETLRSVWAQTWTDYEVIVVNDGSPDDTEAVLRPYVEAGRIRYVAQANAGQAAARNNGIALARGEFIALLDDDDLWPPDKLAWQVAALEEDGPEFALAYGYQLTFGEVEGAGRFPNNPHGDARPIIRRRSLIGSPGQTLIRASALHKIGGFDPDLWGIDDWDLYIRLADVGYFSYREKCALHYRVHPGNASRRLAEMYENAWKMRRKHFGDGPPASVDERDAWLCMGAAIRRHYVGEARRTAGLLWRTGKRRASLREAARAVQFDPADVVKRGEFSRWLVRTYILPKRRKSASRQHPRTASKSGGK